jgi:hypothetical protein
MLVLAVDTGSDRVIMTTQRYQQKKWKKLFINQNCKSLRNLTKGAERNTTRLMKELPIAHKVIKTLTANNIVPPRLCVLCRIIKPTKPTSPNTRRIVRIQLLPNYDWLLLYTHRVLYMPKWIPREEVWEKAIKGRDNKP